MLRLRQIEEQTRAHERRLAEEWRELASRCVSDEEFARCWRAIAAECDFAALNALVEKHNRYYPAEARLPMDPRTGDFVPVEGRSYRRDALDTAAVLARFPAVLAEALAENGGDAD